MSSVYLMKSVFKNYSLETKIIWTVCVSFLIISLILLPNFNNGNDFFIFSSWSLFSSGPPTSIRDITWDDGKTFLYRDYRSEAKGLGINIHTLFYLLSSKKIDRIQRDYCSSLKKLSQNNSITILEIRSSLANHIFFNQQPIALNKVEICND